MRTFNSGHVIDINGRPRYAIIVHLVVPRKAIEDGTPIEYYSELFKEHLLALKIGAWRILPEARYDADGHYYRFYCRYFPGDPIEYEHIREEQCEPACASTVF